MSRSHHAANSVAGFGLAALAFACAQSAEVSVPMSVLKKCADISEQLKRLACYDQVAERPTGSTASTAAPVAKAAPSSASAPAADAAPSAAGAATAKQSFGLYSVEHPAPPPTVEAVISAKVISLGSSSRGHPTVTLEGDQVWELDSGDPVLAAGQMVTVKRGTLGSFILTTAAGRLHRAHRVR